MKLIKVNGIVIKEVTFKDNDKIITVLTDKLGKISCMARGAKKTNSPILASSQYLVYSEFVLYKGNNFYYVNSTSIINMFYKLRIDFDKLQIAFELTKILQSVIEESEDTSKIIALFLNTIYVLENLDKPKGQVVATFKIKLFSLLGFAPRLYECNQCNEKLYHINKEPEEISNIADKIYYDFVNNTFLCNSCGCTKDRKRTIEITHASLLAIKYVVTSDIKKIFNFELKDIQNFELFSKVYTDAMMSGA
ncbi:MAG: DNA repair protein RecO [Clostridia bacterium]